MPQFVHTQWFMYIQGYKDCVYQCFMYHRGYNGRVYQCVAEWPDVPSSPTLHRLQQAGLPSAGQ